MPVSFNHKRVAFIFLFLCLSSVRAQTTSAQTVWIAGPQFSAPARTDCSGVASGNAIYALGGTPLDSMGNGRCDRLTVGGNTWAMLAPFESLFFDTRAVGDGAGRFITIGGFDPSNGDQGADRLWDPIEGFAGDFPQRPEGAAFCGVAVATDLNSRIYAVGGSMEPGTEAVTVAQRYDAATNAWSAIAPLPNSRVDAAAAYDSTASSPRFLVIGGLDGAARVRTGDIASFDPAANSWSNTEYPDLPTPTSHARAVRGNDGRIYVIGGRTGKADGVLTANVWRYDRVTNAWQSCPPLPTPRERHGAVLGSDDCIWVLGGFEPGGATPRVDRLLTIRCPQVTTTTGSTNAWIGAAASLSALVFGTAPFEWQWFKNGAAVQDGVQADGSVVSGAQSAALLIEPVTTQTAGEYHAQVTNDCGSALSPTQFLAVHAAPPPTGADAWVVTDLHPGWGSYSYANGSVNGDVYGSATMPVQNWMNIDRPVLWVNGGSTAQDLTAIGVGGAILAGDGNTLVGWCWYPIMIQGQLWHFQYAAKWTRQASGGFAETPIHQGGYEYSVANDVEGDVIVGTGYQDVGIDHVPTAFSWSAGVWHSIGGAPYAHSGARCVDDGIPYGLGIAQSGGSTNDIDAIRWVSSTGQGTILIDPIGSIEAAEDGVQVGTRNSMATIWAGTPESGRSLHPTGAQTSEASGCHQGIQAGSVDGHAGVWFGTAQSWRDLHIALGAGYTASHATGVEVLADGTIVVVGSAYPSSGGSVHAMRWVATPAPTLDLNGDSQIDAADLAILLTQWGGSGSADFDHDGLVAASDLAVLLDAWGT